MVEVVSNLLLASLVLARSATAQAALPPEPVPLAAGQCSAVRVIEGIVLTLDGVPAEGAVVMSSAGGRAVTDAAGCYRLEVETPRVATSLQVTAVDGLGLNLVASTSVVLDVAARSTRVDPLVLEGGTACSPRWVPTFGGVPGVDGIVYDATTFDDGSGPALYACGTFQGAGGVPAARVAKWDGSGWWALGSGLSDTANAMTTLDDGSGPALYVGGRFTSAGGVTANRIAKWDGASWSALRSGLGGTANALTTFDDGSGPALYVGGQFTSAGGGAANRIAKWDGASWSPLGSGVNHWVETLAVYDDGRGPALYVGGQFTSAGGGAANRIAKWDGTTWSALDSGLNGAVHALTTFDDGRGPALYVGGRFTTAGGIGANRIAKWDGASWSSLGSGIAHETVVYSLTVFDDGRGPALFAGGFFSRAGGVYASNVARWDGSRWSALASGLNTSVFALAVHDEGRGSALYAGGDFYATSDVAANGIARWNGVSWSALGTGLTGGVSALEVFDEGSGPALYAAGCTLGYRGGLSHAAGVELNGIGKWDGSTWSSFGGGLLDACFFALRVFDDGSGPALYAGGGFNLPGEHAEVVKWDGGSWSAMGELDNSVRTLEGFDDGTGPALHAGGHFTRAGSLPVNGIAKWNGSSWSPLGSGVGGVASPQVLALTVYDDGGGAALYAGGYFTTAGGVTVNRIAKWNGSTWSALRSGTNGVVSSLAVFDDGTGPALYVGGNFTTADGAPANRIAKWDGSSWSALGSGMNTSAVEALEVFDDGSGPALYAGGGFTTAGGVAANGIAKWNGSSWSPLGSGTSSAVRVMAVYKDSGGKALFGGGAFHSAIDSGDSYLARWGCASGADGCVQGPDYWKTHACDWPAPFVPGTPDPTSGCPCDALHTLSIGSIAYDQCELLSSLAQSIEGNALRMLARALIAAKLNVLNGASDGGVVRASCAGLPPNPYDGYTVAELIAAADELIATGTTDGVNSFTCGGTASCPCPDFPANILTDCVRTATSDGNTLGKGMVAAGQLLELYGDGCGGVQPCPPARLPPKH